MRSVTPLLLSINISMKLFENETNRKRFLVLCGSQQSKSSAFKMSWHRLCTHFELTSLTATKWVSQLRDQTAFAYMAKRKRHPMVGLDTSTLRLVRRVDPSPAELPQEAEPGGLRICDACNVNIVVLTGVALPAFSRGHE